jgi:diketogulonate reductase-like aldo/keto reductase
VRFAKERGLSVTAFSVFGASSYVELGMATSDDVVLKNPIVTEIAIKYGKTAAQVLLRWAIQRGTRALHKTITPERMSENRDVFDFYIMPSDIAKIDGLNKNMRFNDPGTFCEPGMGTFCPIYD